MLISVVILASSLKHLTVPQYEGLAIKDILEKRKQQVEQRKKLQAQYDATNATPE